MIIRAGEHPIPTADDLPRVVAEAPDGSKLPLSIERDGKTQQLVAEIGKIPANIAANGESQPSAVPRGVLGVQLAPLTPELRKQLQVPNNVNGVVVTHVAADSPIASMGVKAGDMIQLVDEKPVTTPEAAAAVLQAAAKGGNILLLIDRHGASEFVGCRSTTARRAAPASAARCVAKLEEVLAEIERAASPSGALHAPPPRTPGEEPMPRLGEVTVVPPPWSEERGLCEA